MGKYLLFGLLLILSFSGCGDNQEKKPLTALELVKSKIGKENMVLEIGASSCKSCIEMKKIIDTLKNTNQTLPIYIVDVYEDMNAFAYFKIKMIPTQIVLDKNGNEVYRYIGGVSREELLHFVELSKNRSLL